ncbi:MAG: LacI family DNA-binding transcriptional regulator [Anaerolineales bacterium]|jgi:LacI family transcriptional regulator
MANRKRVTIKEVAREAGVSTQTVSRVVNERPDVAPETRKRVLRVIQELEYHPSALARSLIQQRSYTLGVVIAGLKYIGPSRTLNGITAKAEELGYTLLLKEQPRFESNNVHPLLQSLLARQVDGIIWAVPEVGENREWVQELDSLPVPMVFLAMEARPDLTIVSVNNYAGGKLATEHLLQSGCRNIGHISGPLDWWEARQRKQAWHDTLGSVGIQVSERHWTEGNWSSSSGEQAIERLFQQFPEMDGIFVANDQMAISVLQAACRQDIKVPEQLGVVGFDGIAESAYLWPPLTTVDQDQQLVGSLAVEEVINLVEANRRNKPLAPRRIVVEPELIVRDSTLVKKKDLAES